MTLLKNKMNEKKILDDEKTDNDVEKTLKKISNHNFDFKKNDCSDNDEPEEENLEVSKSKALDEEKLKNQALKIIELKNSEKRKKKNLLNLQQQQIKKHKQNSFISESLSKEEINLLKNLDKKKIEEKTQKIFFKDNISTKTEKKIKNKILSLNEGKFIVKVLDHVENKKPLKSGSLVLKSKIKWLNRKSLKKL